MKGRRVVPGKKRYLSSSAVACVFFPGLAPECEYETINLNLCL